jgi:hypothetical protein
LLESTSEKAILASPLATPSVTDVARNIGAIPNPVTAANPLTTNNAAMAREVPARTRCLWCRERSRTNGDIEFPRIAPMQ